MGFITFGCIRLIDILLNVSIFQVLKYIHIKLVIMYCVKQKKKVCENFGIGFTSGLSIEILYYHILQIKIESR